MQCLTKISYQEPKSYQRNLNAARNYSRIYINIF